MHAPTCSHILHCTYVPSAKYTHRADPPGHDTTYYILLSTTHSSNILYCCYCCCCCCFSTRQCTGNPLDDARDLQGWPLPSTYQDTQGKLPSPTPFTTTRECRIESSCSRLGLPIPPHVFYMAVVCLATSCFPNRVLTPTLLVLTV